MGPVASTPMMTDMLFLPVGPSTPASAIGMHLILKMDEKGKPIRVFLRSKC